MGLKISIVIALLGFLPLAIALYRQRRLRRLQTQGDIVTGTVLSVAERRGYKGSVFYQAVIEYPVFNSAPITGAYSFNGKKGLQIFQKGRKLQVYYDKEKPQRFIPKDAPKNNGLLIFTIIVAVAYVALSIFLFDFMKDQAS